VHSRSYYKWSAEVTHAYRKLTIKELPVYALTVDENGAKLVRASDAPLPPKPTGDHLTVMRLDMRGFAVWLSRQTGRTVVDVTGLTGRYDIRLDWNRNEGTSNLGDPSLFTAIEEQLGLGLAPRQAGVDVLIIDGAEKRKLTMYACGRIFAHTEVRRGLWMKDAL
jgi:uncharacterized protein (TIGR03435 family)